MRRPEIADLVLTAESEALLFNGTEPTDFGLTQNLHQNPIKALTIVK